MLRYLIQKEFLQIRRNSFLPRLIIVFPIVIMCVMPWVMNQEVKNVRVCVVDNDRSTLSQRLVHAVEASRYFIFSGQKPSYQAALKEIETSRADIVMVVPQNYSRDITLGRQPQVLIAANAVNGIKGSIGSAYLAQITAPTQPPPSGGGVTVRQSLPARSALFPSFGGAEGGLGEV
ncbi:MAG: ABC transporter permease, partial [Alloprevotella sp.]|nr:ABC transporter permease [Alloprevotella sp.]